MQRIRLFQFVLAALALLLPPAALAQAWEVVEPAGNGARASVCPLGEEGSDAFLCFRVECSALEPLHFSLDLAGRGAFTAPLDVGVGVDGGDVGVLTFTPHPADGYTHFTAGFDPRLHEDMVDLLQRGRRANLLLNLATGVEDVPMGLTQSADSLLTAMRTCPQPVPPVDDPASQVLAEVVDACQDLGGTVAMEPGFERREDLDGDGREDFVIDYAAAACSEAATLNCGSGGCTVGFFLARDTGYVRMFSDVIRGYEVFPGGFLALDLHGSACGLYGFEACRKVFDVAGDAPVLVEEIGGPEAETMTVASAEPEAGTEVDTETASAADAAPGADPVVVAETDGVEIALETPAAETEGAAPVETASAETGAIEAAPVAAEASPEPEPEPEPEAAAAPPADDAGTLPEPDLTAAPPDGAPEAEPTTLASVAPASPESAAPVPPAAAEASATETPAETPAETAAPAVAPRAPVPSGDTAERPSSRHLAGPAPALAEGARFRGDGTLIKPDDTAG